MGIDQKLYVAEIEIPTELSLPPNFREVLPSREYFGIRRGYWRVLIGQDHLDTHRCLGLLITVEFPAGDHDHAEDKALQLGEKFGQLAAFYGGSPWHAPLLKRLDVNGGVIMCHKGGRIADVAAV